MNIKLFHCKLFYDANIITFTVLAYDKEQARVIAFKAIDSETKDEINAGDIEFTIEEFKAVPSLISMKSSIRIKI